MLLRLTAKLAEVVNGLDLSHCEEGDVIDVSDRDGRMLLAEGWADRAGRDERVSCAPKHVERAVAADEGYRGWRKASGPVHGLEAGIGPFQPSSRDSEP